MSSRGCAFSIHIVCVCVFFYYSNKIRWVLLAKPFIFPILAAQSMHSEQNRAFFMSCDASYAIFSLPTVRTIPMSWHLESCKRYSMETTTASKNKKNEHGSSFIAANDDEEKLSKNTTPRHVSTWAYLIFPCLHVAAESMPKQAKLSLCFGGVVRRRLCICLSADARLFVYTVCIRASAATADLLFIVISWKWW